MPKKKITVRDFQTFTVKDLVYRASRAVTGEFITFDKNKCNGCGNCALVCAANLWTISKNNQARLSPKYREHCFECAACYAMCEQDAIEFRYPNGGSGIIIRHG
jgi:ferredoxin-like protein FixX